MKNFLITFIAALILGWSPCRGSVRDGVSSKDSLSLSGILPEIEVFAQPPPFREVIPSQHLDGEMLESLNSHNVADAIRYFSGVQIKDYGGVGGVKTVDIRSMGTNHLGVFYDGIQLGNAQNGQIDLGKFSLDNIEEISLYSGQKSEIFQSAKDFGSAGSIYLRTRRPRFEQGKKINMNVTFRSGSFGLLNPSFRLEYKFSKSIRAALNAEYTYATGRYKFRYRKVFPSGQVAWDTTAVRKNGDIHAFRIEGGVFGAIPQGDWYAKLYYYDSAKGIPGAIVNNIWKNSQRQWDKNFFAQGSLQKSVTPKYDLMVNVKFASDYMKYLNPDTTLMYINNSFRQYESYMSAANKYEIMEGWDADLSVDWQWNSLSSSMVNFSYPRRNSLFTALATSWRRNSLKAQASLLGTFVFDRSRINDGHSIIGIRHKSFVRFTPAIFLSWRPWRYEDFNIRAFYKRVFRMPTFNDLYYTDIGNADLKPEYATQYNVGAQWTRLFSKTVWRMFEISADSYYNCIKDKIIAVPKGTGQYRWMMMNIGKVKIYGLDLTAKTQFTFPYDITLNVSLNYTWQSARDFSDPSDNLDEAGTYKGQIAYIPRNSGSLTGNALWKNLSLSYSFIYVGERWDNSSNIPANYVQPWYTHDASVAYRFLLRKTSLKATLEVNNLLNQQYEVIRNYPMPGRNFKLIFQVDI